MSDDLLQPHATDGGVSAVVVLDSAMNYALVHNGISPLKGLVVENSTDQALTGMKIEIELSGPVAVEFGEAPEGRRATDPWAGARRRRLPHEALRSTDDHLRGRT